MFSSIDSGDVYSEGEERGGFSDVEALSRLFGVFGNAECAGGAMNREMGCFFCFLRAYWRWCGILPLIAVIMGLFFLVIRYG